MGRITVQGGQGVRGVENGILLDSGCDLPKAQVIKPFAASLGDEIELDVQLIACPSAAPPEGRCQVRIGDSVTPWIETQQGFAKVPVPLPDLTGTYQPELHCEAGGQVLPTPTPTLYLTYAPPRPIVDPPEEVWYERACSWGAGLGSSATEREVLDTILSHLYQFGRNWRYGTCNITGSDCTLGTTTVPTTELLCNKSSHLCKCPWTDLVEGDTDLNFSDCYIFSQVMQYIAATMGIGGMAPYQTLGPHQLGFATHPTARALDPKFTGNLLCGEPRTSCGYTFYNHELRKWGDLIYDPTFGKTYDQISKLFGQSVTATTHHGQTFEKGVACLLGPGYGGYSTYVESSEGTAAGCSLLGIEDGAPLAQFSQRPLRLESSQGQITVQVEIAVRAEGTYVVSGKLTEESSRQSNGAAALTAQATVPGTPGTHEVPLTFASEDAAGPYQLVARLDSGTTVLDKLEAVVGGTLSALLPNFMDSADFMDPMLSMGAKVVRFHRGKNPAKLANPSKLVLQWVSGSGRPVLQATIPVHVRRPKPAVYGFDARISSGETTLAYGGGQVTLPHGITPLEFDFQFAELPAPGTYEVALSLHWLAPVSPLDGFITPIPLPPLPASAQRR